MSLKKKEFIKALTPEEKQRARQWGIIANKHAVKPGTGRVLFLQDHENTKYDCVTCGGSGHTNKQCKYCKGTGFHKGKEINGLCNECVIKGEVDRAYGYVICPTCQGKKGTIVLPDAAKQKPLSGTIIAVGNGVTEWDVGMKILITQYVGTEFVLEKENLRIIPEKDVIGQYAQLRQGVSASDLTHVVRDEPTEKAVGGFDE